MAATNLAQAQKNETKIFITTALMQLLHEQPLEKVSVRQVAEGRVSVGWNFIVILTI